MSASAQQPLTRTMFTLGRRPTMLYFNLLARMVTESLTSCRSSQKWCLYLDTMEVGEYDVRFGLRICFPLLLLDEDFSSVVGEGFNPSQL